MFLLVVSATHPIDGIWCLSYGKPLINPNSCGGGVNYNSLYAGIFGNHNEYSPKEEGVCKEGYSYSGTICRKSQLGFYEKYDTKGILHFDSKTFILNMGWILFPLGALFSYMGLLQTKTPKGGEKQNG